MSRHTIPSKQEGFSVDVGWDNPMMTFFAQVERRQSPEDERDPIVLWLGAASREHQRPETMAATFAPYASLTPEILKTLNADRRADLDHGPTPLQREMQALFEPPPEPPPQTPRTQETPMSESNAARQTQPPPQPPSQSGQTQNQPGQATSQSVADGDKPGEEARGHDPLITLINRMRETATKTLDERHFALEMTTHELAKLANILGPQRLNDAELRNGAAYALQHLEKITGATIPMDDALRQEMKQRATTMPGLTNSRMKSLLEATPDIADRLLVQHIRGVAEKIVQQGTKQDTRQIQQQLDVLENRVRLAQAPQVPGREQGALPDQVRQTPERAPPPSSAGPPPGQVRIPTGGAAQGNEQPRPERPRPFQQEGAVRDVVRGLRVPNPSQPPRYTPIPTAVAERISLFEQRLAAGKTDRLIRAAERSGVGAINAAEQFVSGPGRGILGKMESAASTEAGGMQAVMAEMQPGGRYADLRTEFDNAYQQDKIFAGAYDKMVAGAAQFGKDRLAVNTNFQMRNLDIGQLDDRFQRAEESLGEAASKIPGRTPGKSALDEMADKVAELLRTAVEKVRAFFGKDAGAEATPQTTPAPGMSM
jgi:hypothetical protein